MQDHTSELENLLRLVEALPVPEMTDADKTKAALRAAQRGTGRPGARVARGPRRPIRR